MASAHRTVMITDCIKVVDSLLVTILMTYQIRRKVKSRDREIYNILDLHRPEDRTVRKSLQVNDQVIRSVVNFHFLLSIDVFLAFVAIPLIFVRKDLILCELIKAIVQAHIF
jgi:hypothetical protein